MYDGTTTQLIIKKHLTRKKAKYLHLHIHHYYILSHWHEYFNYLLSLDCTLQNNRLFLLHLLDNWPVPVQKKKIWRKERKYCRSMFTHKPKNNQVQIVLNFKITTCTIPETNHRTNWTESYIIFKIFFYFIYLFVHKGKCCGKPHNTWQ